MVSRTESMVHWGAPDKISSLTEQQDAMKSMKLSALTAIVALASAIIPDVEQLRNIKGESTLEPGHQSLPDLLQINDVHDLDLTWQTTNLRYDTGRLILDQGSGSLWSIAQLANSVDEWTAELTFRSTGQASQDAQFHDNGLAFWFVDPENTPISSSATENYGGPAYFDGFQIVMNNRDAAGLKIFMNDGSTARQTSLSDSVGNCVFNYLDSNIPFTVRVSYSRQRKWFKVQVDNNLCFKTDSITIPASANDLKFGVTGNINSQSSETFEILKLSVWSTLTEDAIDDHGLMADGQLKVQYKTMVVDDKDDHVPPAQIRQSLMERTRLHQQQMMDQRSSSSQEALLQDIVARLEAIEKSISNLGNIPNTNDHENSAASKLQGNLETFQTTITNQFSNMVDALSSLNQKVIGEVREHQHGMDEISKKVDLLMANHKEITYQYNEQQQLHPPSSELTTTIVRWVLTPVILCIVVLSVFIYRLRHDIKHSKLL